MYSAGYNPPRLSACQPVSPSRHAVSSTRLAELRETRLEHLALRLALLGERRKALLDVVLDVQQAAFERRQELVALPLHAGGHARELLLEPGRARVPCVRKLLGEHGLGFAGELLDGAVELAGRAVGPRPRAPPSPSSRTGPRRPPRSARPLATPRARASRSDVVRCPRTRTGCGPTPRSPRARSARRAPARAWRATPPPRAARAGARPHERRARRSRPRPTRTGLLQARTGGARPGSAARRSSRRGAGSRSRASRPAS